MTAPLHVTLLTAILHAKSVDGGDEAVYDALRVVVGMHKPHRITRVDSLECGAHGPLGGIILRDFSREEYERCPDCVITHPEVCSSKTCMDCGTYPCETLQKISDVFAAIID